MRAGVGVKLFFSLFSKPPRAATCRLHSFMQLSSYDRNVSIWSVSKMGYEQLCNPRYIKVWRNIRQNNNHAASN